jgi:hypothetical protein
MRKTFFHLSVLLSLGLAIDAKAADWSKIPENAWSKTAEDFKASKGVVLLEDQYHFQTRILRRSQRYLVLNAAGRETISKLRISNADLKRFAGRTIQATGVETPFSLGRDVMRQTLVQSAKGNVQVWEVIPPGLSDHCLIDLRWDEPIRTEGRPFPEHFGARLALALNQAYPVDRAEIWIDRNVQDVDWTYRFEVSPGQGNKREETENGRKFIFERIPEREEVPFSANVDLNRPLFLWFWAPDLSRWIAEIHDGQAPPMNFFTASAQTFLYEMFENEKKKSLALKRWCLSLGQSLPEDKTARTEELLRRLWREVKPVGLLKETEDLDSEAYAFSNWSSAVARKTASAAQLRFLYYHLLKENQVQPRLILAIDREDNRLRADIADFNQFDAIFFAMPQDSGDWRFYDPGSTWKPLGLNAWLQGSNAFVIQTGASRKEWNARLINLPAVTGRQNKIQVKVQIRPGADEDHYHLDAIYMGDPAVHLKVVHAGRAADENAKDISSFLGRNGFQALPNTFRVKDDAFGALEFSCDGLKENGVGRRRFVQPFPFLRSPAPSPLRWPETRSLPIHFPFMVLLEAEALIPMKHSIQPDAFQPMNKRNLVGEVVWLVEPAGDEKQPALRVRLKVEVNTLITQADRYPALKEFTSWIDEALNRQIEIN